MLISTGIKMRVVTSYNLVSIVMAVNAFIACLVMTPIITDYRISGLTDPAITL